MDASHQSRPAFPSEHCLAPAYRPDTAVDSLTRIPGVAGVEPLNIAPCATKPDPEADWEGATLVMRDDYDNMTYDWLELKEGSWPEDRGISIERITSDLLRHRHWR